MKMKTTRFGEIEVREDEVLTFPQGLLGFGHLRKYALRPNPKGGPFQWLQSLEDGSVAFVVVEPREFFVDYVVTLGADDLAPLKLADPADAKVLAIVTVTPDPRNITANLQGPVVLNPKERLALQFILTVPGITTRHALVKGGA